MISILTTRPFEPTEGLDQEEQEINRLLKADAERVGKQASSVCVANIKNTNTFKLYVFYV